MANRLETLLPLAPSKALERARADLARSARRDAEQPEPTPPATEPVEPALSPEQLEQEAATTFAARLDLLRGRLVKAREDTISALLFLGDAQRDCDALLEASEQARWRLTGQSVALLQDALRRATPSEMRHLDLISLLIDALAALRRAETSPDMGRAGQDLLRGLKLATSRELGSGNA